MCAEEDSNLHGFYPTGSLILRVYQFRHPRLCQSKNQNKDNVVTANKNATNAVILLKFRSARVWPIFPDAPGPPSISDNPPPFPLFNKTKAMSAIDTTI